MSIYQLLQAIEEIAEEGILSDKELQKLNRIKTARRSNKTER